MNLLAESIAVLDAGDLDTARDRAAGAVMSRFARPIAERDAAGLDLPNAARGAGRNADDVARIGHPV